MSWREVWLTLQGIERKEAPFRRLGQLMVDLWASKPVDIKTGWPLPFDAPSVHQSTFERLKQRQLELKWQQQMNLK